MPKDTDEIVVAANGTVRVGAVGAAEPATISAAFGAGWTDIGHISDDGITIRDAKTLEIIRVWDLFYPARRIVTERDFTVAMALAQFSGLQVELAFGGATVTEDAAGEYRFEPPSPEVLAENALAIEWADGDKNYRLILPRGMVVDDVETKLVRTTSMLLPITFGVVGQEAVAAWYGQTDDPTFIEAT